jgi:hypothetical protein
MVERLLVKRYIIDNDADEFVDGLQLTSTKPHTAFGRIVASIVGSRRHM